MLCVASRHCLRQVGSGISPNWSTSLSVGSRESLERVEVGAWAPARDWRVHPFGGTLIVRDPRAAYGHAFGGENEAASAK